MIRQAIKRAIEDQGLTQVRLADLAKIKQPRLSDFLSDSRRRSIRVEDIDRLLAALGLRITGTAANQTHSPQ